MSVGLGGGSRWRWAGLAVVGVGVGVETTFFFLSPPPSGSPLVRLARRFSRSPSPTSHRSAPSLPQTMADPLLDQVGPLRPTHDRVLTLTSANISRRPCILLRAPPSPRGSTSSSMLSRAASTSRLSIEPPPPPRTRARWKRTRA